MKNTFSREQDGFTLLELMVTVAIVAILSTIAYSSYSSHVIKSRRAAAAGCLQERAQFMERYYTTNLTYAGAPNPPQCGPDISPFYTVGFAAAPSSASPRAYTLQIVPQGVQTKDKCGTLTLNARGQRSQGTGGTEGECW